jgi:hypothetical protein
MVLVGPNGSCLGLTRIKRQVSRGPEENGHFYWGENRVKTSLLFLTLETLDFESDHVFESHGHLKSAADIMPALTSF